MATCRGTIERSECIKFSVFGARVREQTFDTGRVPHNRHGVVVETRKSTLAQARSHSTIADGNKFISNCASRLNTPSSYLQTLIFGDTKAKTAYHKDPGFGQQFSPRRFKFEA